MIKTKREKNSAILHFWFYFIALISLTVYVFSWIIPKIKDIELNKTELQSTYSDLQNVISVWPNFEEFKDSMSSNENSTLYVKEVLNNIDWDFYDNILVNTTDSKYLEYLDTLKEKYSEKTDYEDKLNMTSWLLPFYSEIYNDDSLNILTDYRFINYIESIVETFNVSFEDSIWIESLEPVEWYSVSVWDSSLEKNIYSIPLDLSIEWTKESILNFIYYIENVWNVSMIDGNLELDSSIDNDFSNFKNKIIKGQKPSYDYNIFNNQIIDITKVVFPDYIDSSFEPLDNNNSTIYNILNTQWREYYSADISLNFYIKGIPVYLLEEYIDSVIVKFSKTKIAVLDALKSETISSNKRKELLVMQKNIITIGKSEIIEIQKAKSEKENIDSAYKNAYILNQTLDNYLNQIK